jgi:hypothetical protein
VLPSTNWVNANQEIRRAQAALEKSQNELRARYQFMAAVLDTVGALILVLDPEGRVVEFNRACGVATTEVRRAKLALFCSGILFLRNSLPSGGGSSPSFSRRHPRVPTKATGWCGVGTGGGSRGRTPPCGSLMARAT